MSDIVGADMHKFKGIVLRNIFREGITDLMDWLDSTDFYTAPASTKYHGAYEGGLLEHSIGVYERLRELADWYKKDISPESIAIVALFHDLCKVDTYKTEMRWRKNDRNQWEQYPVFVRQEDFAYGGHGSKSVYLIQNFMRLNPDEASAINCHMGAWDKSDYGNPSEVFERNTLAWLLHVADEADTYLPKEEADELPFE